MNLDKIQEALEEMLETKGLKLFELSYHKSDSTLSVMLDEKMDMDGLESVSGEISQFLDAYEDEFEGNYFLDVSTVGAERPIRNGEELRQAVGEYIYVKGKGFEYYGTLESFDGDRAVLEIMEKNIRKSVEVDFNGIRKMRYAVKF